MEELHCCALSLLEAVGFRCIAASAGRQRDALRGFHNVGYSAHFEQRLLKTLIPRPPRGYCQPVCCSHGQFREAIVFYLASDRCNITTPLRSNKITCEWKTNALTILTKCLSSCGLFLGNYFSQVCRRRYKKSYKKQSFCCILTYQLTVSIVTETAHNVTVLYAYLWVTKSET